MNKYLIAAASVLCVLVVIVTVIFQLLADKPTEHAKSLATNLSIEAKQAEIIPVRTDQCPNSYQLSINKSMVLNENGTNASIKNTTTPTNASIARRDACSVSADGMSSLDKPEK